MPPANRTNPQRAASSQSLYSLHEFLREFPDGRIRESERRKRIAAGIPPRGPATKPRPVVFAAAERGGRVRATVIGMSRNARQVRSTLCEFVLPKSMVFTDDWSGYDPITK